MEGPHQQVIAETDPEKKDNDLGDESLKRYSIRPELGIAILYIILGTTWIVSSDWVVHHMITNQHLTAYLSAFKGINFICSTGLVLFFILRKSFGGWRRADDRYRVTMMASRNRFRNLSKKCEDRLEEERTRIAREVHDGLGQRLTGLKMHIRRIEDAIEDRNDRSLNGLIDQLVEACELVDDTIDAVRTISHGLRPAALDDLGLFDAIREEVTSYEQRLGVKCEIEMDDCPHKIDSAIETALFRILQECLTNIARHAKAKTVRVVCRVESRNIRMVIEDDGVGMANLSKDCVDSLGLLGMIERAQEVGAKLMIESTKGKGTTVVCMSPMVMKETLKSK